MHILFERVFSVKTLFRVIESWQKMELISILGISFIYMALPHY